MQPFSLINTIRRYNSLRTHRIAALPIAILMPHSACNCRCVMCDIWKGNRNARRLEEEDVKGILESLKKLGTRRVLMSGGEALLNPSLFSFCRMLNASGMKVTLLSTGMTLARHAVDVVKHMDEVIVSLDGDEVIHDRIRNVKGAFDALRDGVRAIKDIDPGFRVTGRSVIHRLNYDVWPKIVHTAMKIGLSQVSFLPADVTSEAFNRAEPWSNERRESVLVPQEELPAFGQKLEDLIREFGNLFESGYIAERPEKLRRIYQYYAAHHGLSPFPEKKCNAPWVSAVVEADGKVRPCFFHDVSGSVKDAPLHEIINSEEAIKFRSGLDVGRNPTCEKCVCYLNLGPRHRQY